MELKPGVQRQINSFSKASDKVSLPTLIRMEILSLKSLMNGWEDADYVEYYLACCLGLMKYDQSFNEYRRLKSVFWTNNQTKRLLQGVLHELVEAGLLEFDGDGCRYRWCVGFKDYWME